jgi:LEA14-like dessication related protein
MKTRHCLLLLFIVFMAACSKPLQPQYLGFENLQISKSGNNESLVSANVKFYNPNNFPLELKRADINLFLNDKQAAHSVLDTTVNIPKLDSFYVPVSFNVSFGNIINNALQFLLNGKAKINAEGYVRIKKSGFTFNVPIHYEVYESLDSLLQQIR